MSLGNPIVANSHPQSLFCADDYDQFSRPRNGRVQQVALQHHIVLRGQGHDHGAKFRALALVYTHGIGQYQFVQFRKLVCQNAVLKSHAQHVIFYPVDAPDIPVENVAVVVISHLHHFVAHPKADTAPRHLLSFGIQLVLQDAVEIVRAGLSAIHRHEHLNIVNAVQTIGARQTRSTQSTNRLHDLVGFGFLEKKEIGVPIILYIWHLATIDRVGIGDDAARLCLSENFVEFHDFDNARCDHIFQHISRAD